jgi:hypothetical protein
MSTYHVNFTAGGTGNWERPVRVDDTLYKVGFEAHLAHRLVFENGHTVHLRARYAGVDAITADGSLPVDAGYGHIECRDEDGDWLSGRVDWEGLEGPEGDHASGGVFTFSDGSGKWEGANGTIEGRLWFVFEDPQSSTFPELPPTKPVRVYGFIQGEGKLTAPNLKL